MSLLDTYTSYSVCYFDSLIGRIDAACVRRSLMTSTSSTSSFVAWQKCITYTFLACVRTCVKRLAHIVSRQCELERILLAPVTAVNTRTLRFVRLCRCIQKSRVIHQVFTLHIKVDSEDEDMNDDENEKCANRAILYIQHFKHLPYIASLSTTAQHATLKVLHDIIISWRAMFHLQQRLDHRRNISFDLNDKKHTQQLINLWNLLRPGVAVPELDHIQWTTLGFQGTRAWTDFRGMGMLALDQLERFSSRSSALALSLSRRCRHDGIRRPSFAITGITLSNDALNMLIDGSAHAFLVTLDGGATQSNFDWLYAYLWLEFDHQWEIDAPDNVMAFQTVHQRFLSRVRFNLCTLPLCMSQQEFRERLFHSNNSDDKSIRRI